MRTSFTHFVIHTLFLVSVMACTAVPATAQQVPVTVEDYGRAEDFLRNNTSPLVYRANVQPNWLDGDRLWYQNTIPEGKELILADPGTGTRALAFDAARMDAAIAEVAGEVPESASEQLRNIKMSPDGTSISFSVAAKHLTCTIETYSCRLNETASIPTRLGAALSPDGKKEAFIREHNLWMRDTETGDETQLTTDGIEDFGYATNNAGWIKNDRPVLLWSPDSKKIATFQHDGRGVGEMYLVSTKVGRPELQAWKYPLPGDSLIFRISRVVIHVDEPEPRLVRLQMPPDPHRGTTTDHIAGRDGTFLDVEWSKDASQLAFVSSSRDHKEARLRVADPETGEVRDVLEEITETYFESGVRMRNWHVLFDTNEVLWFSERDDWGHLYLYDLATGELKHRITQGDWAVQQVLHIDYNAQVIYFTAGGREPGNPYFRYLYRVKTDGSDMRLLTPEPGNHTITFSPSGNHFVDSYSTPVVPPVTVLRDTEGNVKVVLEETDISILTEQGWQPPVPFQVKARDGETDLYGLMYKPTNFDPAKSYPILNYLYPGPQSGSIRSWSFAASRSDKQAVAELGFIVVEVNAMGTPGRSKSFHDAYYGNMGDNGIPDQVATIKQLAAQNSWMDLNKVGIWGHSGGGFASTAAILRYPDFYKVAVSGAGNHDNRNYEDDWGEKWQGLLEENPDGTTNYDNQSNHLLAKNLTGKLLIGHGTLDSNVPPSNTLLMVDALIAANKDFDLLMIPNGGHGFGRGRTYWMRKRWDYFVRHLKGVEPPKEYEFGKRERGVRIQKPKG